MNFIKDTLFSLTHLKSLGNITDAADKCAEILKDFAEVKRQGALTVKGYIKGESDYKILLDAHIDQIGFTVTDISGDGFLTVAACGGIDLRILPSKRVDIHTKSGVYPGTFCSIPPHLLNGDSEFEDLKDIKIDSLLGEKAKEIIALGDFVTFSGEPCDMLSNRVLSPACDDRAGVTVLLELAKRFKEKKPPVSVVFQISNMEELGLRGAKTAVFDENPDEAIAIDVSFATAPDVPSDKAKELSKGAMIGISPTLNRKISDKLLKTAEELNLTYQTEVMASSTGTNADALTLTKSGIKTGLVSIPIRNMHTPCEVLDLSDILSTCDILENYIRTGGIKDE